MVSRDCMRADGRIAGGRGPATHRAGLLRPGASRVCSLVCGCKRGMCLRRRTAGAAARAPARTWARRRGGCSPMGRWTNSRATSCAPAPPHCCVCGLASDCNLCISRFGAPAPPHCCVCGLAPDCNLCISRFWAPGVGLIRARARAQVCSGVRSAGGCGRPRGGARGLLVITQAQRDAVVLVEDCHCVGSTAPSTRSPGWSAGGVARRPPVPSERSCLQCTRSRISELCAAARSRHAVRRPPRWHASAATASNSGAAFRLLLVCVCVCVCVCGELLRPCIIGSVLLSATTPRIVDDTTCIYSRMRARA